MNTLNQSITGILDTMARLVPEWMIALLARWSVAYTFWSSGRSKVSGFLDISESTFFLFEHEYALPLIPSHLAAHMATYAEHFFPILIILGLFTRFAALALIGMTAVIQLFVYPDAWSVHMWWAFALLFLMKYGAGAISVDYLLRKRFAA